MSKLWTFCKTQMPKYGDLIGLHTVIAYRQSCVWDIERNPDKWGFNKKQAKAAIKRNKSNIVKYQNELDIMTEIYWSNRRKLDNP